MLEASIVDIRLLYSKKKACPSAKLRSPWYRSTMEAPRLTFRRLDDVRINVAASSSQQVPVGVQSRSRRGPHGVTSIHAKLEGSRHPHPSLHGNVIQPVEILPFILHSSDYLSSTVNSNRLFSLQRTPVSLTSFHWPPLSDRRGSRRCSYHL